MYFYRSWRRSIAGYSALFLVILTTRRPSYCSALASSSFSNSCSSFGGQTKTGHMNFNWGVVESVDAASASIGVDCCSAISKLYMKDDGTYPNNDRYPLIFLHDCWHDSDQTARQQLIKQGWTSPWAWGIFSYHHYHSTAWELLLCIKGHASVQMGGPTGPTVQVQKGDLLYIPPGLAHKQLAAGGGFLLLGAYPDPSVDVDILRGTPTDEQRRNIRNCPPPKLDPLLGIDLSKLYR